MFGPIGVKAGPPLCGGTAYRPNVYAPMGSDVPGTVVMKPDAAIPGCGDVVSTHVVRETSPLAEGERPLFAKTANVVLCPHCDGVTLPTSIIQAPVNLGGEPTEPGLGEE